MSIDQVRRPLACLALPAAPTCRRLLKNFEVNGTSLVENARFERSAPSAQDPGQYPFAFKVSCGVHVALRTQCQSATPASSALARALVSPTRPPAARARPQFESLNITGAEAVGTQLCVTIVLTESLDDRCDILKGPGRTMEYYLSESEQEYCCSRCRVGPGRYADGP